MYNHNLNKECWRIVQETRTSKTSKIIRILAQTGDISDNCNFVTTYCRRVWSTELVDIEFYGLLTTTKILFQKTSRVILV